MASVKFKKGLQDTYDAARTTAREAGTHLPEDTLYFTTDTHRLFLGENEISTSIKVTGVNNGEDHAFPSGYDENAFPTISAEYSTGEITLGSAATQNVLTGFGPGEYVSPSAYGDKYVPTAKAVMQLFNSSAHMQFRGELNGTPDYIEKWCNGSRKNMGDWIGYQSAGYLYKWIGPDANLPQKYLYVQDGEDDHTVKSGDFLLICLKWIQDEDGLYGPVDEMVEGKVLYHFEMSQGADVLWHQVTDWNDEVNNAWVYEEGRASDGSAFTNGSNNKPSNASPETILVGTVRRVDLTNGGCIIRQEACGINRHENAKYIRFGSDIASEGTITWQDWKFITNEDEITYCKPAGTYTFGANVMDLTPSFGYSKIFVIQMEQPFTAANGIGVNTGSYISYIYNAKSEKITYLPAGNWVIAHCSNDNGTVNFCLLNESQNTMVGTSSDGNTPGKSGLVPRPSYGDNTRFLRGDGVWAQPTLIPYGTADTMETTVYYDNEAHNVSQITVNATENMLGYQYCTITFPQDYTLEAGNEKIIFLISTSNTSVPLIPQYKGNPLKIVPKGTYQWVKVDGNQTYELIGTYGPEWEQTNNG